MQTPNKIARTGRVQQWIDNPTNRLPVSCTIFNVQDSMEGSDGIEASWRFVSHALRYGAGVAVHLSDIRPKGSTTNKGPDTLVASGPVSFAKIYSTLNEILRRGGTYRNGACVIHLDINHADIIDFVQVKREELPWVKRCVDLTSELWTNSEARVKEAIIRGIARGDIWLSKIKYDNNGNRIRSNVCLEVYLPSRGTCLLQHINLGACRIGDLRPAFRDGMSELCSLHSRTGVGESGEYLKPEDDRQVGLGVLGLANFLANNRITYAEFGKALEACNNAEPYEGYAGLAARELFLGIQEAANIARENNMERAFAIAPTASCSYRSRDIHGFTSTPEIAPPISRVVDRDSGEFGVEQVKYGDKVEIASEVGWDAYKLVADQIMIMLNRTGLLHGYSFNSWSDMVTYDEAFIEEWLLSPQTSLYYALQVMGDTQDKTDAYAALEDTEVEDYLADLMSNKPDEIACDCQQ
ncbi:ribonucleotide reductase domain-containing protein [Prochlorococcus phage P-GSP1]|uniref:Ribonucleotide reductase domain-containing protein n=1 Tax=Prochlorococcus phage P-GSP1 TaxID=382262 RepID=M1UAL3_9CAUD|nr:ribonucleotide reductase [Prochlorococcus phage P-GSP1]AGG54611.1 ribonucleotide reductase domain-containing protein [Prochlorococcus phage P-GSP1]